MLKMKLHQMQAKQQGFTLLELLVVITLLAVLSLGALIAYEGIGDNAQATAAANNTGAVDRAIRNYKAVSLSYPNQWDNLAISGGTTAFDGVTAASAAAANTAGETQVVAYSTKQAFGGFNFGGTGASFIAAVAEAFDNVGIDEIQQVSALATGLAPNKQHNEGANASSGDVELATGVTSLSILPSSLAAAGCKAGDTGNTQTISRTFADTADVNGYSAKQNAINDSLAADECHLVIALGFGGDAAHSTADSPAAIAAAATYSSRKVNPANSYARYVALFHVGSGATAVETDDVFKKAKLLAIVDPEGNTIDTNLASATATN